MFVVVVTKRSVMNTLDREIMQLDKQDVIWSRRDTQPHVILLFIVDRILFVFFKLNFYAFQVKFLKQNLKAL